jgi:hypothetical protein
MSEREVAARQTAANGPPQAAPARPAAAQSRPASDLLPLVYQQLRHLAHSRMGQEKADHTLQATALVH